MRSFAIDEDFRHSKADRTQIRAGQLDVAAG
jgi:hypothetical protein